MPSNKAVSTKKKKSSKKRWVLWLVPVVALVGFISWSSFGGAMVEQSKMAAYLKEKYGQEFVVKEVRVTGAGLGVQGSWRADAYPKSDPSVKFEIRRSQTTNEIDYETFLQTKWTKEGSIEVEDFISKNLPDNEGYYLEITPGNSPGNTLYDLVQGSTPSLSEVLKIHKDNIVYTLSVNDVVSTSKAEPSDEPLKNAMKVIDFVKAKAVGMPSINYGYRDTSFTEKTSSSQQKYQYRIKLEREALQKVNSLSDLKQYFEVIKY